MGPLAGQTGLQVGELGDFDLKFAGQAVGAQGENVEDELGSVDDPQLELVLQVAGLSRRQAFIENRQSGGALMRQVAQFGDLAAPDEGARVDLLEVLEDFSPATSAPALCASAPSSSSESSAAIRSTLPKATPTRMARSRSGVVA